MCCFFTPVKIVEGLQQPVLEQFGKLVPETLVTRSPKSHKHKEFGGLCYERGKTGKICTKSGGA